jgi:hypothetical protein
MLIVKKNPLTTDFVRRTVRFRHDLHNILWLGSGVTLELGFADATRKGRPAALTGSRDLEFPQRSSTGSRGTSPGKTAPGWRDHNDKNNLISANKVRLAGSALTGAFFSAPGWLARQKKKKTFAL